MKKLLSILLIGAILCSFPCLQAFASTPIAEPSSLTEVEKETTPVNESNESTILDECLSNLEHCDSILSTDTIFSQNQSFSQVSIHFNETSESFLQKITSDNLSIDGYTANENNQSISLTDYFTQNQASRFDIVDMAYQNNLITETEKIETYCNLYENRQFENMTCLHKVITTLSQYQLSENTSDESKERIQSVFSPSSSSFTNTLSRSVDEYDTYPSYSSTNFIVRYEPGVAYSEAVKVANHLETVRNKYVNEMGYRAPIPESTQPKYRVVLLIGETKDDVIYYPDNEPYPCAGVVSEEPYGVRYSSRMEIYNFTSLTEDLESILAHELFHSIQRAYYANHWISNIWFDEATACWATIMIEESSFAMDEHINGYLSSTVSLIDSDEMGTVLFPLVMQDLCDTSDVIREIWEEYGNLPNNFPLLDNLRDVINTALAPYGESFDSVFLTMSYYNFSPSYWYSSLYPGGSTVTDTWIPRIDTTTNTFSQPRAFITIPYNTTTHHHSIELHSNRYHKFVPDQLGQTSKITIEVEFSGSDAAKGTCHFYYVKADGTQKAIKLPKSGPNKYVYVSDTYGGDIQWCGMVISNTSTSQSISYTIRYHVERGTKQTVSLPSNLRYYEKVEEISNGDYRDFLITFATSGNKLIQTFGTNDTYIELYNENNERVAWNDDSGDRLNALISYSVTANKQYRIRVMYINKNTSGKTKLVIIPSASYSNYESIPAYTNHTSGISGPYTQNQVDLITYKRTSQTTVKVHIEATVDSYLYIINPRSVEPIAPANNSSPDLTKNLEALYNDNYNSTYSSEITKNMLSGVPYLIIACKHNPSSSVNGGYLLAFQ